MEKQKDPIVPDMKPSAEDIELRKRQMQARRQAAQRAAVAKAPVTQAQPAKQTLAIIALVIALVMGAAAAFLFMQLQIVQKQLNQAQQVITDQGKNLQHLNDQLSATGENANLSVDALKVLVKDNNKEIRKLWDVANKRNKANISSNSKAIKSIKSSVASVSKKQAAAEKAQASAITAVKSDVSKTINNKVSPLSSRLKKVEAASEDIATAQLGISQNTETIQALEAKLAKIKLGGDMGDIKMEIEDIQIRLDRIQNAMGGSAQ